MKTRVIEWLSKFTSTPIKKIDPDKTLLGDLGIDGDDGLELIEDFIRTFGIDPSGIRIDRHFGPEGLPLSAPFRLDLLYRSIVLRQSPETIHALVPIHVRDLIEIADSKTWTIVYPEKEKTV